jgi:DNA-binding IclR family transcriptional regulator
MGSPSVDRAVQILDFLTTHPGRGFTLSELSRRLRISKATAHAILTTLTARSLLLRNPATNEYRLGPALVPMGDVAERSFPALTHARREAGHLAAEFDTECVVIVGTGDELLIVGRAGVPGPLSTHTHEGQRQPVVPPVGSTVLAWTNHIAFDTWLDRLGHELTESEREHHRAAIEAMRRRGYAVGFRVKRLYDLDETYAKTDLYTAEGRREISGALAAVAHDEAFLPVTDDYPQDAELSHVAAPVFGPDGTMILAISLIPTVDHRARDIPELSRAVLRAAGRVMAEIDGRLPDTADGRDLQAVRDGRP